MDKTRPIAQIDMDGTIADFDYEMIRRLNLLKSDGEPEVGPEFRDMKHVPWMRERVRLIMSEDSFWDDLPKLKLGYDVVDVLETLGYDICILTQGPKSNPRAWARKVMWCEKSMPGRDVTVTRRKGQVYGKVLVDDYPEYVLAWLEHRPRGLVIMPANWGNKDFSHPQVVKYDGTNLDEVRAAITKASGKDD